MSRRLALFNVRPGARFLATAAKALVEGTLVKDFPNREDPLSLASATIYAPTRRSARLLVDEIGRALGARAFFAPRIVPLGQIDDLEAREDFVAGAEERGDPLRAIDDVERRLGLMRLIGAWRRAVAGAIEPGGAPLTADSSASDWRLAGDLAALIDEFVIEGVAWSALDRIVPESFDRYWNLTLDFLRIAGDSWPRVLDERGFVEPARLRAALVESDARRISTASGALEPVFAFGSTGTNRATAALLAALARSPRCAVVLPGLDLDLDDDAWRLLESDDDNATHPQAALHRLLSHIGAAREDVVEIGSVAPPLRARAAFLSCALLPAAASEKWRTFDRANVAPALADLNLVEAENEREEALALALLLRSIVETKDATAALVTPDRACAARVKAELLRWDIEVEDSAGEPLTHAACGVQAQLALAAAETGDLTVQSLALLNNPLTRLGFSRERLDRLAHLAEIGLLRAPRADADATLEREIANLAREGARRHPALREADAADWEDVGRLFERLAHALRPVRGCAKGASLRQWVAAHQDCLGELGAAQATSDDELALLSALFDRLAAAPDSSAIQLEAYDYAETFGQALKDVVRGGQGATRPRLQILGLLEARLIAVDHAILAGLDESVWPPAASLDPFLNRVMRRELGLSAPERRIGQTAHDFVQALGAPAVTLSRARKRAGNPTTASRFLQRMEALAGSEEWRACRARGEYWLALARLIDEPAGFTPCAPPSPRPPLALRPKKLSVTRIETLRRDPYSIYAEHILRLQPLAPIGEEFDARRVGEALHATLVAYAQTGAADRTPDEAVASIEDLARDRFAPFLKDCEWRAFDWPRLRRVLAAFAAWDRARREAGVALLLEQRGELILDLGDGSRFALSAIADRIERRRDGSWSVIDFKSGSPPSPREVKCGFAPQLTLESAMLARGGFGASLAEAKGEALYVRLGGRDLLEEKAIASDSALASLANEHLAGAHALLSQFRESSTPFLSRPFPQFASRFAEFDHLARVKEWSIVGAGAEDGS